jgi:Coenzyme PQQ synthesis protein D (PqqD)
VTTNSNAGWCTSPNVRSTYSQDGAVLLDIRRGLCYSLNAVAAQVWRILEASPSGIELPALVDAMQTYYEVSHEELQHDVSECLSKLETMELVQRNGLVHASRAGTARV